MIHNDHLGTPQKMTDATGVVVWSADYKPFGEATVNPSSTITNNLRFPGQYYDAETGLHQNYTREYNPAIGRYEESDRMGLAGGANLYVYVKNNSIRRTDRFGLDDDDLNLPVGLPGPSPWVTITDGWRYHGKWCGPGWTGGHSGKYIEGKAYADPVDALDAACKKHDICYADCRKMWPCDPSRRQLCQTDCNEILANNAADAGHKYSSLLWWWMTKMPARPEPNDCRCK